MTKIEKLREELASRQDAKRAELEEVMETIKVKNEMTKLDSPIYNKRELVKTDMLSLQVITETIAEAYAADDRKMSLVFGYGLIPSKILAVLRSIQFSKAEEKQELLMLTGLDEQIIESTLDAFGNTAYFSKAAVEVVPAIPMDLDKVTELLEMVALDMQLVAPLDLSRFNAANVAYQYERAQLRADEMLDNTKEYITEATAYEE